MHRKIIAAFTVLVAVSLACTASGTPTSEPPPAATETPTNIPTSTFTPSPIPDTPTPTPQVFVITVPADILWVDTGIDVNPSQTISIVSTGDVNTWGGADISNSAADGQLPYICEREDCAMKDVNFGALVGRINEGETFRVGTSFVLVPTTSGRLYLTVNDWEYYDNLREFEVTVTIP